MGNGLSGPMDDIFGPFPSPLPQLDMAFPPDQNGAIDHALFPMQHTSVAGHDAAAAPAMDQCIPCMLHHGFTIGNSRSGDSDAASTRSPTRCMCVKLVNQHFTSVQDSLEAFHSLSILQQSVQSAESILECGTCFGPIDASPGTCRNVYLLGSLLSSISSSYGDFFLYQRQRAAQSLESGDAIKLVVGQPPDERQSVEISLDGKSYGSFIRASLRAELARLLKISEAFADRQAQIHSRGHEGCEKEKPCTNTKNLPAGKQPAEVCPKVVDITKAFACFRTVDQVRAVMEETEQIISS